MSFNSIDGAVEHISTANLTPEERRKYTCANSITSQLNQAEEELAQREFDAEEQELQRRREQALIAAELDSLHKEMLREQVTCHEIDLAVKVPEPVPVIAIDGVTIASEGNLSVVVGEAKSKKTFLCSAIVGSVLNQYDNPPFPFDTRMIKVLWVDTEQSYHHVRRVTQRIHTLAGFLPERSDHRLHVMTLRELEPRLRADKLYAAIELYHPKLVVIDGIADLQHNTNDLEESERIITRLMALSTEYRCHIMSVLHTNPNSDKARGHTGSALQRKAETVMYVHRAGDMSVVEPQFCRNEPFERFAFRVNDKALPEPCDLPQDNNADNICVNLVRDEYGGAIERMVLINKILERTGATRNAAQVRLYRAIKSGLLMFDTKTGIVSLATTP